MSKLAITFAEKPMLNHLQAGGSVYDDVGKQCLAKFATKALADSSIAEIAKQYRISHQDICFIYANMLSELMPNPCIQSGGLMLVPTLFFMEPFRFEGLASEIHARTNGKSEDERLRFTMEITAVAARETWNKHTQERGEAPFKIYNLGGKKSAGCAGMIVIGGVLASALGLAIGELIT